MRYIKSIVFIVLLLVACNTIQAQVMKFRAIDSSYTIKNNNKWEEWSEWEESNVLISFDTDLQRVKIYSKETQIYDIISTSSKEDKEETVYEFHSVDQKGMKCRLRFTLDNSNKKNSQLYIDYYDFIFVYNIKYLD